MRMTDLEAAALGAYHDAWSDRGFPHPDRIKVVKRDKTERGAFIHLACTGPKADLPDWLCTLPDHHGLRATLQPNGVELGIQVYMLDGYPVTLEYVRANYRHWNGRIGAWRLETVMLVA